MRHLGEDLIKERLEEIYEIARDLVNIDIAKELLPILPGVHYIMGGVKTDVDGLTATPGLYSAGEAACVSVHGANRVGANSLLTRWSLAAGGGTRGPVDAGQDVQAGSRRRRREGPRDDPSIIVGDQRRSHEDPPRHGRIESANVGLFRSPDRLNKQVENLKELRARYEKVGVEDKGKVFNTDLLFHIELGYMIDCAEMITTSAIERKESRGAHTRLDFPNRDDENC
jgi:succinate dehydrogenase / fumarate reductase flavoprotein subunit